MYVSRSDCIIFKSINMSQKSSNPMSTPSACDYSCFPIFYPGCIWLLDGFSLQFVLLRMLDDSEIVNPILVIEDSSYRLLVFFGSSQSKNNFFQFSWIIIEAFPICFNDSPNYNRIRTLWWYGYLVVAQDVWLGSATLWWWSECKILASHYNVVIRYLRSNSYLSFILAWLAGRSWRGFFDDCRL